jgi:hypothetical protein
MVLRRFLGVFARPEHPLALFLDDLQWLDAATLELLEQLITDPDVRHVLLVGAYRDNEVSPSHPLMRTVEAIRKAGARMREIVLAPLELDDVHRLVVDSLHSNRDSAHPLARLVHEKTGGNPFFAIQFLTRLPAIQHVQLLRRQNRLDRRCKFVRAGGKAGDGPARRQLLPVRRPRQPLGDAWSSSGLDALRCRARAHRLRRWQSRRLRPGPVESRRRLACLNDRSCAVFWTPGCRHYPRALVAGVKKAPRHKIAGRMRGRRHNSLYARKRPPLGPYSGHAKI